MREDDRVAEVPTDLADRLYALPPGRFVAERDAAAARARSAGDRAQATAITKLRRPTQAAWLVNLLALRRPDLVGELVDLAGQLRAAQRRLHGGQLRELAVRRRDVVAGLVAAAQSLVQETEPELARAKLPLREVEATLVAAIADEQVAAQVRTGRLLRPVAPASAGAQELAAAPLRVVPGGGPDVRAVKQEAVGPGRQREQAEQVAQAELAAAQAELDGIVARKREAKQELWKTDAAVAALEAELADRRAARSGAAARLTEIEAQELAARRAVVAAQRRLATAD